MTKPKVQTRKVWVILSCRGKLDSTSAFRTKRSAEIIARCYDGSDRRFGDPYRVVRATLTWPTTKGAKP